MNYCIVSSKWMSIKIRILCGYTNDKQQAEHPQELDPHYSNVVNCIDALRFHYGDNILFICDYETCLIFNLYHEVRMHNVKYAIIMPATMAVLSEKEKIKTYKRDSALIASCLACHDYNVVHASLRRVGK